MRSRPARAALAAAAAVAGAAAAAACTVPPPFHTLETAGTLPARGLSVMVAAGGGAGEDLDSCCGGAAARVRVGIGDGQELGIDGSTIFASDSISGGFRLGYKNALSGRLALFGGAGAFFIEGQQSVGADLGLVVSARADGGPLVPYAGARIAAALPIDDDLYAGGGLSQTLVIPIGLARRLDAHWQGLIELGGVGALSEARSGLDRTVGTQTNLGLYGALAITWRR